MVFLTEGGQAWFSLSQPQLSPNKCLVPVLAAAQTCIWVSGSSMKVYNVNKSSARQTHNQDGKLVFSDKNLAWLSSGSGFYFFADIIQSVLIIIIYFFYLLI